MEIRDTTFGSAPSYSLEIVLETTSADDLTRFKKVCIAVSILENLYTIYGIDESHLKSSNEDGSTINLRTENALIVSPFNEFKTVFVECLNTVKSLFSNYKIVPVAISAMTIEGLQVRYLDKLTGVTIYNALFNQFLEFRNLKNLLGEKSFGYTDWEL
ncbi:hypothetical protein [Pedobacter sp. SG908]|uniref:hypothetical protein n=1 Tax=Pedobacter sp. SG908 TaxID=2587135 RepID=UPI001422BADF|nr:hypothetical protein [Pedobacter sp. SG908]NII83196.1 hypothetical protein [Pedobacter sp. SG908]